MGGDRETHGGATEVAEAGHHGGSLPEPYMAVSGPGEIRQKDEEDRSLAASCREQDEEGIHFALAFVRKTFS